MNYLASVDIGSKFGSPFGVVGGKSLGDLSSLIAQLGIVIAGLIVLFMFIMGGIKVMQSAGQDDPKKAAEGKQAMTKAGIGFIIVFIAFWILRIIEIMTGTKFFTDF